MPEANDSKLRAVMAEITDSLNGVTMLNYSDDESDYMWAQARIQYIRDQKGFIIAEFDDRVYIIQIEEVEEIRG